MSVARLYGQPSVEGYISALRIVEPTSGAKATVRQDEVSLQALQSVASPRENVSGMRVNVFFDNSQNAHGAASAAQEQLKQLFPGVPSDMLYSAPFFKVQAGDCLNRIEATSLRGKLMGVFPKAYIVRENIPLEKFMHEPPVIEEESPVAIGEDGNAAGGDGAEQAEPDE